MGMNRYFEIHDSTLSKVTEKDRKVVLSFSKAYVHQSEGNPGVDGGTGWLQEIELELQEAQVLCAPIHLPEDLADGFIKVGGVTYDGGLDLPVGVEGEIEVWLQTSQSEELKVVASAIVSHEIGEAIFVEEFKA